MALLALNKKKQALAPSVRELVVSLTGFKDVDADSIRQCENYVFSNFLHYQQPMVDSKNVQKSIDGLIEKFDVHGFPKKGKQLKILVDQYISSNLFKEHMQTGVEWYVLQLMVNLAYRPTDTTDKDNAPAPPQLASPSDETIDWGAYLKEGWEAYHLPDDDEDDESWSSESDSGPDSESVDNPDVVINIENKSELYTSVALSSLSNPATWIKKPTPIEIKKASAIKIVSESSQSELWLKENLQNSWWVEGSHVENITSRQKLANFSKIWNELGVDNKVFSDGTPVTLSEYKVIKEILWMFQMPSNTLLFSQNVEGRHHVNRNVTTPSLSQTSCQELLTGLCPYFDKIYDFIQFNKCLRKEEEEQEDPPPFTYKTFCMALMEELDNFTQIVLDIERKVDSQDEIKTITSVISTLNPDLNRLTFLHEIYQKCVIDWKTDQNWVCSTRLLSVLCEILVTPTSNWQMSITLKLFIGSFHVYLNIIDTWLCEGRLEDFRDEFLVHKNGAELEVMPYGKEMQKYGIEPVSFLSKLVHLVRDAGQSMAQVIRLHKLEALSQSVHNKGNLYTEFVSNVKQELEKYEMHDSLVLNSNDITRKLSDENYTNNFTMTDQKLDPGLSTTAGSSCESNENFRNVKSKTIREDLTVNLLIDNASLLQVFQEYLTDDVEEEAAEDTGHKTNVKPTDFILHNRSDKLSVVNVHQILNKQLGLIYNRHALSARIVTQTLINDYHLIQHFLVLRKVLLMEAGNLIQNFYSFLFSEMDSKDWKNERDLTLHLVLSIEEEHPELGANFSVIINKNEVDKEITPISEICNISIGYSVGWPVNMVITTDAIARYNSIFTFLLCIKYAFWILYDLRFYDFNKSAANSLKRKRLFVLKIWMQHCVTTIHSYFMGHVLHNCATELETTVLQADFIDEVIQAHNKFLVAVQEHCLQNKMPLLKRTILKMLELVPMLQSLWRLEMSGNLTEDTVTQLEDKYILTHQSLSFLLGDILENAPDTIGHLAELAPEIRSSIPESHHEIV